MSEGDMGRRGYTPQWVSYDRWDEAHRRLEDRITDLADRVHDLETEMDGLPGRLAALETESAQRRNRQWALLLAFVTSLVLPLAVAALVAWAATR